MTTAAGRRLVRPDAGLFHHRQRAAPEPHRAVVGRPAPAHRGAELPDDVIVMLNLDRAARLERDRRRAKITAPSAARVRACQ
jgi:hypothetical protein